MSEHLEIPSGEGGVVHVWFNDDETEAWACAAYDHGPLCRLCQTADGTTLTLLQLVGEGKMTVRAGPDGELGFKMTDEGQAVVRDLIITVAMEDQFEPEG